MAKCPMCSSIVVRMQNMEKEGYDPAFRANVVYTMNSDVGKISHYDHGVLIKVSDSRVINVEMGSGLTITIYK